MTLSGDNIRDIALGVVGALQTIALAFIVRRQTQTKKTVESVDSKVDKVHALVDSRHSELKGELKKANEFSEKALGMVVNREPMPPDSGGNDD